MQPFNNAKQAHILQNKQLMQNVTVAQSGGARNGPPVGSSYYGM